MSQNHISKTRTALRAGALAMAGCAAASPALAHTDGAHHGFAAGVAHMATGLDHLAIAALIGFWVSAAPRARAALALGAYGGALLIAGLAGVAWPGGIVDGVLLALIAASGALILWNREGLTARVASVLAVSMAAVQALAHVADVGDIAADPAFVTGLAGTTILAVGAFALLARAGRCARARAGG